MFAISSYFYKLKRRIFRSVQNIRRLSLKRPAEDISDDDDDEAFMKQPYQPLRKKMCPSRDEPWPLITRSYVLKPTLHRETTRNSSSLVTILEDEPAELEELKFFKTKKSIDVSEPATRQAAVRPRSLVMSHMQDTASSSSTKTIQPNLSTVHKQEYANNRKILKTCRNLSVQEKSKSRKRSLGSTNYRESNKKPLPISSAKWRQATILESFRIEEKKQYQQLLQHCTLNQSHSSLSPSHSTCEISSSSNSSPIICDVRWSRSSSCNSIQSDVEWKNTSPTSLATSRLLKSSELENEFSEDHKRHPRHPKSSRTKAPLSDITKIKEFSNGRMGTSESVIQNQSLYVEEEENSLGKLAKQCYPEKNKCSPIPVVDLCLSDSNSLQSIKDSDSDSVEVVDEFPHGKRKNSLLNHLYDRKWKWDVHDEHSSIGQETDNNNRRDEELQLERRSPSQALHDKVENRFKHFDSIYDSIGRLRPIAPSMKKVLFPPLTPEMQDEIEAALIPYPKSEVLIHKFNIKITRRDVANLDGLNWLNDEVINFYLNLIMERSKNHKGLPRVYVFSTFFYPKLHLSGHKSVSRWTKKIDIFTYDILLVPIHLDVHWCMATVDFKERCITYYDSMLGDNCTCLELLLEYLKAEYFDKKKKPYTTAAWKLENMKDIPEQMNGSDCGVFSCKFAEYKSRLAPLNFKQEDMPYFRRRMVYEIVKGELFNE